MMMLSFLQVLCFFANILHFYSSLNIELHKHHFRHIILINFKQRKMLLRPLAKFAKFMGRLEYLTIQLENGLQDLIAEISV